ncbi:MAG: hypothetical protein DME02_23885 [Candidatus Rokuibacteriota bacterium]|nr:MAG: hypothetical protein DME02_23885 [Candidatus Rokubacteria bacterium]
MTSPLENLAGPGQALRNALESRFDLAYNASHSLCLAARRAFAGRPHRRMQKRSRLRSTSCRPFDHPTSVGAAGTRLAFV